MIDDDPPPPRSATTALVATHRATPGPEEEMRGSLEDTDTIRSLQVSRLLFISCSFSLSLFLWLSLFLSLLVFGSGDKTGVKVRRNEIPFLLSVTLLCEHGAVCGMYEENTQRVPQVGNLKMSNCNAIKSKYIPT